MIVSIAEVINRQLNTLCACPQSEKLQLKKEQLIAKVQRDENDRSSVEVKGELLFFSLAVFFTKIQKQDLAYFTLQYVHTIPF